MSEPEDDVHRNLLPEFAEFIYSADLFRSEIVPGLTVVTNAAGRVVIEAEIPVQGDADQVRCEIPDPARLVVAIETARDRGSGAPMEGSPMQAAITGMLEVAAGLDLAAGFGDLGSQAAGVAAVSADLLRQRAGDLLYGRLPDKWMALPVAGAVPPCRTCHMRSRRTPQGPVALRHRPGCTGQEDT